MCDYVCIATVAVALANFCFVFVLSCFKKEKKILSVLEGEEEQPNDV